MAVTKPTQFELALLAAALTGGVADMVGRVESALTLWYAAGQALASTPEKSIYAGMRTLKTLLPALMPKRKSDSKRKELFMEYLKWYVRGGANSMETLTVPDHASGNINKVVKFTVKMATEMAEKLMSEYENDIPDPVAVAESFTLWDGERFAKVKSKRGTAGGRGKQASRIAKKMAGTAINRKNPRRDQ